MLSGRLPFEGNTFPEILQKQLIEPPPNLRALRPDLPPPLAQLVHQMVAREVNDRPQTMAQVVERMQPSMPVNHSPGGREPSQPVRVGNHSGPVRVVGVGPPSMPGQTTLSGATGSVYSDEPGFDAPQRRKPTMAIGIGAGIAVLLAGVLWLGMGGKKKTDEPARVPGTAQPTASPTPAPVPPPTAAPAPAPTAKKYSVYVDTQPPGAQVLLSGKPVGVTPGRIELPAETANIKLRLAGFRDEMIEVADGEQQVVRLHKETPHHEAAPAPTPPPSRPPLTRLPAPPPVPTTSHPPAKTPAKKPAIGLDD
jgi:hypothetical protein